MDFSSIPTTFNTLTLELAETAWLLNLLDFSTEFVNGEKKTDIMI